MRETKTPKPGQLPSLAILGAGPTGLEAALAAVENNYPFTLYEAAEAIAGHVRDWGHVQLFSPWKYDISPRARRALTAAGIELPEIDDPSCPTGRELVERVLAPLAALPQIQPSVRTGVKVESIGRQGLLKHEEIGSRARENTPFRLLLSDTSGRQWTESADVILDCTGSYSQPNALGDGGIPAPGEQILEPAIRRTIPDFESERGEWAGRTVLLAGAGHSAMTAAVALARLAEEAPGTSVIWALRREQPTWHVDPDDPLPERSALAAQAVELASGSSPSVHVIPGVVVHSLSRDGKKVAVGLRRADGTLETVLVDRLLALTGSVGDHHLYRQLQVHECYATSGPMKLAAALLGSTDSSAADCLAQEGQGVETLINPEPGFFILGAKSYGRNTAFLMRLGWQQVDEIFELFERKHRSTPD